MHNSNQPKPSEITSEINYINRRQWIKDSGLIGLGIMASSTHLTLPTQAQTNNLIYQPIQDRPDAPSYLKNKIATRKASSISSFTEPLTPYADITHYNNFYEFGLEKSDPADKSGTLKINPWQVTIDGLCNKGGHFYLEDILKPYTLEDRIYRFRCVEAWSMVVPWLGFSLADLIKRAEPKSSAKFIQFTTLVDPKQFPNQRSRDLNWPYLEGLRMDEAMHPLTILAVGLYGRSLPDQNGAPLRLIVPWKYGFKSIKSIVRITFTDNMPKTTWATMAPNEYGFYANVNPNVDHPRWSQAKERRLPTSLFTPNYKPTLPFNGYASQVAHLYKGMDLTRNI